MTNSVANLYIGNTPPVPSSNTRWISQSHKHMRVSSSLYDRFPIIGSNGVAATSAVQEPSAYWNSVLNRWDITYNEGGVQKYAYALTPKGPWTIVGTVLGGGIGGEAANAQQCSAYIENGKRYFLYWPGSGASWKLAVCELATPTSVSVLGVVATRFASSSNGSGWIIKVGSLYYLFLETGVLELFTSTATSADGLVANPFVPVSGFQRSTFLVDGPRTYFPYSHPCVFYEDGTWIMYVHGGGFDTGRSQINRYVCTDPGLYPTNWVIDQQSPLIRGIAKYEIDQTVDFMAAQGPQGNWWGFWTGANNITPAFTIYTSPMQEPIMAYDGGDWVFSNSAEDQTASGNLYLKDVVNSSYTASNLEDLMCDCTSSSYAITFPRAVAHSRFRMSNVSLSGTNTLKQTRAVSTDVISGGNPIVAATRVGTTVTITTARPHNLGLLDFVTVSGFAPTGYNIDGTAVTGVPTTTQFTYSVAVDPGASSTLGVYDRALFPGETAEYQANTKDTTFTAVVWRRVN